MLNNDPAAQPVTDHSTDVHRHQALPLIRVDQLHAWYGESHVLHGVDLKVYQGQVVALMGRNGAGRTTVLRAIMGLMPKRRGKILVRNIDTIHFPSHHIARLGIGYCPEERGIFASLTTEENLLLPPLQCGESSPLSLDEIYRMFPNLLERRHSQGTKLSGGEQQMLAIARILRAGSRILLLDEISEGLAPVIVKMLGKLILDLRQRGYTILLVEQNFHFAAPLTDYFYLMEEGKIVDGFAARELRERTSQLEKMLGVS